MPKRNVAFIKPPEPAFIKKMKDAIGYQEPDTIETKRQVAAFDENQEENEDEKPVIVALKPGDLTEEQYNEISDKADPSKKIKFTKPVKKDLDEKHSLDFTSKKQAELQKKIDSQKENAKKIKNTSLLSFDEEEDY